jgi:hypothetical protein
MSYSFSVPAGHAEELRERAEQVVTDYKATVPLIEEAKHDIEAAIDAAVRLAQSLTEGNGSVKVSTTVSGHANADREALPGWSPDMVTVSVGRVADAPASTS